MPRLSAGKRRRICVVSGKATGDYTPNKERAKNNLQYPALINLALNTMVTPIRRQAAELLGVRLMFINTHIGEDRGFRHNPHKRLDGGMI
ncbi:MAG: hypothetical protein J5I90_02535 [Caldilineales bacterium]|nr:hypothetical protein [Caldilineales bacterium]